MTVAGQQIDRRHWESELDYLTHQHEGDYVTIEVLDPALGEQLEVERLPFAYLAYDRKADTVVIAVGGATSRFPVVLRHLIDEPAKILVDTTAQPPTLLITDTDQTTTQVTFYAGDRNS
ncbi:DUF5335 family protein [Kribbella swartbergensis]